MKYQLKYTNVLFHVLGWIIYFTFQLVLSNYFNSNFQLKNDTIWWIVQIGIIIYFYLNYFLFVPKLLLPKKYIWFIIVVLLSGVLIVLCIECIISFTIVLPKMPAHEFAGPKPFPPPHHPPFINGLFRGSGIFLIVLLISSAIRVTKEYVKVQQQKQRLETEKLSAELIALKAQINPHFVFNVLNNICSLARKKSEDTEVFIVKLSQLLRYNLYDDKGDKMPLDKEINFLTLYVDLQKMRLGDSVDVEYKLSGDFSAFTIHPMLLFPFIENAFKHGISHSTPSFIKINVSLEKNMIQLSVINSIPASKTKSDEENSSGIGLSNVQKLLSLLYPEKHELVISNNNDSFKIDLKIKLV